MKSLGSSFLRQLIYAAVGLVVLVFLNTAHYSLGNSGIDLTYDPTAGSSNSNLNPRLITQSDGKIVVFGYQAFDNIDGIARSKIARLNADGTLDPSFRCECSDFTYVGSAVEQPDGKILIGGSLSNLNSPRMARLNQDGSRDVSFVSPYGQQGGAFSYYVTVWGVQADGKIIAGLNYGGFRASGTYLRRLNQDGSFDGSFQEIWYDGWGFREFLMRVRILPDGKIYLAGKHANGYLYRLNSDGTKDTAFESPNLVISKFPTQSFPLIDDFDFQSDGKIVILGRFISINGLSRINFARLHPAGNVDTSFSESFSTSGQQMDVLSDDKVLVSNNSGETRVSRLDANGVLDSGFDSSQFLNYWILDGLEKVLFVGDVTENGAIVNRVGKLQADGGLDPLFERAAIGVAAEVEEIGIQSDGKAIVSGDFSYINGITRNGIARINTDGSLDTAFDPGSGIGGGGSSVYEIVEQPDGKVLIGGYFSSYDGNPQGRIARLNSNGSLDSAFAVTVTHSTQSPSVNSIKVQTDGKLLVGGSFTHVNGLARNGLARLNPDGTLDTGYDTQLANAGISIVVIQSDEKVLIGGSFSGVGGFNRSNLARLNADGTLDQTFDAGSIGGVGDIQIRPDGKLLVRSAGSILRRFSNGAADTTFPLPLNLGASDFYVEPDGKIIVVGSFTTIDGSPRNRIARFKINGSLDFAFMPLGTDGPISELAAQSDGQLLVGGLFKSFEGVERSGLARFTPPAFREITEFDFDGDGRADFAVFRPSENKWYVLRSSDFQVVQQVFAIPGDTPVPADFDGDSKTDFSIFRPSLGDWWSLSSDNGAQVFAHLGAQGDIPLPSDFDGDGRADYVVFRPSNSYWYRANFFGTVSNIGFGSPGDKPLIGDFDGDGRSDPAIFRPSTGDWWWRSSTDGIQRATHWGISTDIPVPADYDGDDKTDFAVYRPSTGAWYILNSADQSFTILPFGLPEDKPVAADYDGDGRADIAVYRPSSGIWYLLKSTEGFSALVFGVATDIPAPNAFVPQ